MSEIIKVVIPGDVLANEDEYNLDFKLCKNKNFFITGTIYDNDKKLPINNAAVAVYQIDDRNHENRTLFSVTFTYEDGTYGISLPCGYSYILIIYS